jgi:hypothetical protein
MEAAITLPVPFNPLITSGVADLSDGRFAAASFSLSGAGFSYSGAGTNIFPPCGPAEPCKPGFNVPSTLAGFGGEDACCLVGTISVGSTSFNYSEGPGLPGGAGVDFTFLIVIPSTNLPSSLTLTGPFTGRAFFNDPAFQSGEEFVFTGQGVVTINLNLVSTGPMQQAYELQHMHFDFTVPEPGTGTLLCVAGAVLWGFRRFRSECKKRSRVNTNTIPG